MPDTDIAPQGAPVWAAKRKPAGYQQITALATVVSLTVPDNARFALIQPTAQNVRWRDDGTNPSATVGMVIVANGVLEYSGDLYAIRFIEAAVGGVLNVSYYF